MKFVRDREQKIKRCFEKTHELFEAKIESVLEAVITSFNESAYITKSQKLLHESLKEIDDFMKSIAGFGLKHLNDMNQLYRQLSMMRSAMGKAFKTYSVEFDQVLNDFEQNIFECDEKSCTELENKISEIEKEI